MSEHSHEEFPSSPDLPDEDTVSERVSNLYAYFLKVVQ